MISGKERGMYDKIAEYQNRVRPLHIYIIQKIEEVLDIDKKNDIKLMKENIDVAYYKRFCIELYIIK